MVDSPQTTPASNEQAESDKRLAAPPMTTPKIEALAAQFEAACKAEREVGDAEPDAAMDAAIDRTRQVAREIVALPAGSDISIMRLKARVYLWGETESFESFAKKAADGSTEAMLVSLFRDLGADSADAELFALAPQLTECDALNSACPDNDDKQHEALYNQHWNLREKINRIPATTLEGLRVKARAAEFAINWDPDNECGVGDGCFVALARSINQDIFSMETPPEN
jgi:hypothetical protein